MLHKFIIAAAWSCLAFIVYATLSSIDARPVIAGGYFTLIERFGAYAVLGFLFYLAYPRRLAFVCVMVFGGAVTLELLQYLVPGRDPRLLDAIEKLLGGAAGMVSGGIFRSYIMPRLLTGNDQAQRE
jgi:VanZ family protein